MNLATPIVIYDQSEDFRNLLREMLTKHGFFHLLEATTTEEMLDLMVQGKKQLLLIQGSLLDEKLLISLKERNDFIIFSQANDKNTFFLAVRFGVDHLLSFPFSSLNLLEKIRSLN